MGSFGRAGARQFEDQSAQESEVFRTVVGAVSGSVLVEDDLEHPMQLVRDSPVSAHGDDGIGGAQQARQV